jgi:hypothetical protein
MGNILISILVIIGTSQLALHFTNWIATLIVKPSLLPRLNFSKGIPETDATMVVVPTMLQILQRSITYLNHWKYVSWRTGMRICFLLC